MDEHLGINTVNQIVKVWGVKEVVMKMKIMRIKVGQNSPDQGGSLDHLLIIETK